jgi:hypothetical protein
MLPVSTTFVGRGRRLSAATALTLSLIACQSSPASTVRELHTHSQVLRLAPADYYGVAWVQAEALAFAALDVSDLTRIDIVSPNAEVMRSFEPPLPEKCARLTLLGLSRLSTGEIGAAEICTLAFADPPETARLVALDSQSLEYRSLGPASGIPSWLAWRSDMRGAVYSVGDDLCSVLYEQGERDGPATLVVTAQSRSFNVGGDPPATCPTEGRASYPAISEHEDLAFMASANIGKSGQELLDLPWALFVKSTDGQPAMILDGIDGPRGLGWLNEDRLVFSGTVGGNGGIWSVRVDGTHLVRIADDSASWLAAAPDGHALAAIREGFVDGAWHTEAFTYDLRSAGL